jgi:hypothetical protein
LRWRQALAVNRTLWHGALFDGQKRFAGIAIEHEDQTGLGDLRNDIVGRPVSPD